MASKFDYFAVLSRAVAGLDRDSYAARGAAYDREHKALLRRLFSADPPHSDTQIEQEQQAFREAIRRIPAHAEHEGAVLRERRGQVAEVAGFLGAARRHRLWIEVEDHRAILQGFGEGKCELLPALRRLHCEIGRGVAGLQHRNGGRGPEPEANEE